MSKRDAQGRTILEGDGTWPWLQPLLDHGDILVIDTPATWFGGDDDPEDNGETASGTVTKGHPNLLGCALPMAGFGTATAGSPLPKMPWHTTVRVYCHETGKSITVPLIDLGPSKRTHHGLDLTQAAFVALGLPKSRGVLYADYRIIGGAIFVK